MLIKHNLQKSDYSGETHKINDFNKRPLFTKNIIIF